MLLAVAIVGYCYADWDNPSGWPYNHWSPFLAPAWDVDGLFVGASVCFFGYTGGWGGLGSPTLGMHRQCTLLARVSVGAWSEGERIAVEGPAHDQAGAGRPRAERHQSACPRAPRHRRL